MKSKGYTIIEVLIASSLMIVLGLGIVGLQRILAVSQVETFENFLSIDQSNIALTLFEKELRTASYSDSGAYPIELADNYEIIFYSDIDHDGQAEKVRYYVSGTSFYKEIINPEGNPVTYPQAQAITYVITEGLINPGTPVFTYYNEDWPMDTTNNPLPIPATASEVRMVSANINLEKFSLNANVHIRTVKDNL
ncbi:MAG: hypothetical protein UV74_C0013G0414 [Candidatus Woesebacteria bacterium GW2011_GWB1_43_14]|uniref:Prepilin-type N-terminal cleavage/methylation domain-containing protein n=1 Tax=Candidatus Woesebacteria bacterium GW2011_GWB1_43_14 TaxID=1618578 RepID=A0A0G1DI89_9BACT|nr:MAG: hypothetical protein UT21_C0001G0126 [Candidatus Woesebacteria bacterium GW2011_GWA1_39_11b]KKS78288.1 MAG: hypothetical protein UV51_C0001G0004 [Candidatus Woesebacteria bacterium GW2011_GWC1_42_9]KKS97292.1 MAG: hypothetical protein UV74_C0013G0414 [Candidatus Woesebacteria bacterium GW2011_GWB1_43_14]